MIRNITSNINHYFQNNTKIYYFFLFIAVISSFLELLSLYSILFIIYTLAGNVGLNLNLDIFYIFKNFDQILILKLAIGFLIFKNITFVINLYFLGNFVGNSFTGYIFNFIKKINSLNFIDALKINHSKILKMIPMQLEAIFAKYFFGLFILISDTISIIFVLIFLSYLYPLEIFTIMLPFLFFSYLIYKSIKRIIENQSKIKNKLFEKIIKNLRLNLQSYDYIRLTKLKSFFEDDFDTNLKGIKKTFSKIYFFTNFSRYFYEVSAIVLILLIFLFNREGGVIKNLDLLIVLSSSFVRILPNLARLNSMLYALSSVSSEINEIQNQFNEVSNGSMQYQKTFLVYKNNPIKNNNDSTLELKNLSFKYDKNGDKIFDNLNYSFKKNEVYLIYSPSGSGKSTLGYIISGLVSPDRGNTYINSQDTVVNKTINYLPQHDFIINSSFIENITLSKSNKVTQKVIDSMDFANLIDFIKVEDLDKTQINDFGNNLSGGQRRRISLARFFHNKRLINIIDEPTNALDQDNILRLSKNLKKLSKDCIVIIFTHEKLLLNDKSFISLTLKNKKIVQK